jgi:FkbM family methyltransferase
VSARIADVSELLVIRDVFVLKEYEPPIELTPAVIVDLGSNVGISVLYFKARYPGARIIAVEPHPETFKRLRQNTAQLRDVQCVQAAIDGDQGTVAIYASDLSWSPSIIPSQSRPRRYEVPAMTLDALVATQGLRHVDLLKIDIEGAEDHALASDAVSDSTDVIIFEFHRELSARSLEDVLRDLPHFEVVRIVGINRRHPLVTLKRR